MEESEWQQCYNFLSPFHLVPFIGPGFRLQLSSGWLSGALISTLQTLLTPTIKGSTYSTYSLFIRDLTDCATVLFCFITDIASGDYQIMTMYLLSVL